MRRTARSGWTGLLLVAMLVILTVGIGFCLFDGHSHHGEHGLTHAPSLDLCLGVALFAVSMAGFTSIFVHPVSIERPLTVRVAALHTPDPPPKSPSRF